MNPLTEVYGYAAPLVVFLANGFAAAVFWLLYVAKRDEMTEQHRLAYVLFTTGLTLNALWVLADRKEVPSFGELLTYVGFALLAYVAAGKNRECLTRYKKLGLWL